MGVLPISDQIVIFVLYVMILPFDMIRLPIKPRVNPARMSAQKKRGESTPLFKSNARLQLRHQSIELRTIHATLQNDGFDLLAYFNGRNNRFRLAR